MSAVRVRHRPPAITLSTQAPGKLAPSFPARRHGALRQSPSAFSQADRLSGACSRDRDQLHAVAWVRLGKPATNSSGSISPGEFQAAIRRLLAQAQNKHYRRPCWPPTESQKTDLRDLHHRFFELFCGPECDLLAGFDVNG